MVTWLAPAPYLAGVFDALSAYTERTPAPRAANTSSESVGEEGGAVPVADEVHRQNSVPQLDNLMPEPEPESDTGRGAGDEAPVSSGSPRGAHADTAVEPAAVAQSKATQFVGEDTSGGLPSTFSSKASSAVRVTSHGAVNAAPTDIVATNGVVAENSPAGTVVATLNAVDADANESFSYNLVGGDTDQFEIQGNQIVVRAGANLDYESASSHSVDVQVTDGAGNTYTETLPIAVRDVADTTIYGTANDDTIAGTDGAEIILALNGNDIINAAGGDDVVDGYIGADNLIGGVGDDDVDGGSGHDALFGGAGDDTLYGGDAVNGKITEIGGDDSLFGQSGNDLLDGGDGDDTLSGGDGNDVLIGGVGADHLDGDDGVDSASYTGSSSAVTVDLAAGIGTGGDAQGDTLTEIENLTGSDHNDTLIGDTRNNVLKGGAGNDVLSGGDGNDTLSGGEGADTLIGGVGNDTMHGGGGNDVFADVAGNDTMFGDAGDDLFVLNGIGPSTSNWVNGGAGLDTVDLTGATKDWTVVLDGGDQFSNTDAYDADALTDDSGVVTFDNGAEIAFQDIENLIW